MGIVQYVGRLFGQQETAGSMKKPNGSMKKLSGKKGDDKYMLAVVCAL
ncbi:MAG: hypothetical protein HYY37_03165 [Candidatus Aenigmarchaeota archaeon]|nr:hypothetical protein [Candidatus Aenigmarchaeota archaeon]